MLKGDKVVCFDTLLEVLILKGVTLHQNCAKCSLPQEVLILKAVKATCFELALQVFILNSLASGRMSKGVCSRCSPEPKNNGGLNARTPRAPRFRRYSGA